MFQEISWEDISSESIARGFKKGCISNSMDRKDDNPVAMHCLSSHLSSVPVDNPRCCGLNGRRKHSQSGHAS
jgi:hypothetical protein